MRKDIGFTYDDLSSSGKWLYDMLTSDKSVEQGQSGGKNQNGDAGTETAGNRETTNDGGNQVGENTGNTGVTEITADSSDGLLTYSLNLQNSWESDGKTCCQYSIKITNTSGRDYENWSVSIVFNGEINFLSGWCGKYETDGNMLNITPESYNGTIAAGGSTGDIGFIISGNGGLSVTQIRN